MPRIRYENKNFRPATLQIIAAANEIIDDHRAQGFNLTLRQLYYQFVARDYIQNNFRQYKNLGSIVNDARMAGLIDWDAIVDRTRELETLASWNNVQEIIASAAHSFHLDYWRGQPYRPEVWIEKDALAGVVTGVCQQYDVPLFSCRGYPSSSEVWAAGQRMVEHYQNGQKILILHLGDHDPSGMDMTRDIRDRLFTFVGSEIAGDFGGTINSHEFKDVLEVRRIALNWDQIEEYDPPPNFAKITDTRARDYMDRFGQDSWELDALPPRALAELIAGELDDIIEPDAWNDIHTEEETRQAHLREVARRWDEVEELIAN